MNIQLKRLSLTNFKGIKNLTVEFGKETNVSGANATGKTTINDAFRWLLFGKDSDDRTDFNIKTLNPDNSPIHNLDHEVEGELEADGVTVILKRTFREKWEKPRGTSEMVMRGHETVYTFNGVPMTMKEYQYKIDAICPEANFKLLTDPLFFPKLPWAKQREMLFNIAGTLTDDEIASMKPEFATLMEHIRKNNITLIEYKKQLAAKRLKIKEELESIPARIDEATRSMPVAEDWSAISLEIEQLEGAVLAIEQSITDKAKAMELEFSEFQKVQNHKNAKITRRNAIEFDIKTQIAKIANDAKLRMSAFNTDITSKNNELIKISKTNQELNNEIIILNSKLDTLREEWKTINASDIEITDDQTSCPTCKRYFVGDDMDKILHDLKGNFLENKAKKLTENVSKGKAISERIKNLKETIGQNLAEAEVFSADILTITEMRDEPTAELPTLEKLLSENEEYIRLGKEIEEIKVTEQTTVVDTKEQDEIKASYRKDIDALKARLSNQTAITKAKSRIKELEDQQKTLSQEQAYYEKTEFTIQSFDKARIEAVEDRINGMFKVVRFKMFDQQLNGGENPTCVCTVNGVPFPDLNNAMKICAGLDIISTLSNAYNVIAPIIIDNRESVNEIPQMDQQIINLIVTKDKSLKVA